MNQLFGKPFFACVFRDPQRLALGVPRFRETEDFLLSREHWSWQFWRASSGELELLGREEVRSGVPGRPRQRDDTGSLGARACWSIA